MINIINMKRDDWIDANAACALLGVKAQTLYAYVSRHSIRLKADPSDARHSLYFLPDLDRLLRLNRRPRARADVAQAAIRWGDPVLVTSISEVRAGTIWLRGHAIEDCAQQMTLEDAAALLCDFDHVVLPETRVRISGTSPFARAMKALADEADSAPSLADRDPSDISVDVGRALSLVTNACLAEPLSGPVHKRIGAKWGLTPQTSDVIRQALVLLSDHELNPSTFAVRVCASTGGSLAAALLAGVATLSGPRHGGVRPFASEALHAALEDRLEPFLERNAEQPPYSFGFGHPLYPAGDPRAIYLLNLLPQNSPIVQAVDKASKRLSLPANIDTALAAALRHFEWPDDAVATIFSVGRTAGWAAHAIEQALSGTMIRPRAKYQGKSIKSDIRLSETKREL
ncbi:MAG: citrate synthase [Pseudomonadota bacterium]